MSEYYFTANVPAVERRSSYCGPGIGEVDWMTDDLPPPGTELPSKRKCIHTCAMAIQW